MYDVTETRVSYRFETVTGIKCVADKEYSFKMGEKEEEKRLRDGWHSKHQV